MNRLNLGVLTNSSFVLILSMALSAYGCQDKTNLQPTKNWYKGNLHTHSLWSDGDDFPEMIMGWYKAHHYQFIALSDHNILAKGDKWITIEDYGHYSKAYSDYLTEYGESWVTHRTVENKIQVKLKTLDEYRGKFEVPGQFLIMQSEEISDEFEGKPIHLNATNIQELIDPQGGNSLVEVIQRNIDAILAQRSQTGAPIMPHVNHPNFRRAITAEDMMQLNHERFFEVYNGHPQVLNMGDSSLLGVEEMWDLINISYLQNGKPLMYGLATDDAHHYHVKGKDWSNAGRGWVMVHAQSLTPAHLISAMEAGDFYASTGVDLEQINFDGQTLHIIAKKENEINYQFDFIGCRSGETNPEILHSGSGSEATYALTSDDLYVRCRITSSREQTNPVEEFKFEMAWTQPVKKAKDKM